MIKLSDRLQMIADEINTGETMCDVGTDHGFLPIYLWEKGISPKVIMADVSKGSLDKARDNCRTYYPAETFDLRLGDGLAVLSPGEADAVAIAGMGGILMTEILSAHPEVTESVKKFIFQPRSAAGKLRYWLLHNGFVIEKDQLVREGKFICNVITAVHGGFEDQEILSLDDEDIRLDVPSWHEKDELTKEFIKRRITQEMSVLEGLSKAGDQWQDKIEKTKKDIEYLEGLYEAI